MHNFTPDSVALLASRNISGALANVTTLQSAADPVLRRVGFWGDPTATVDWCELNYQHSPYIAEFWNTLSNVLFVILGSYGLVRSIREKFEWRFRFLFVSTIVIGLGSAMFHGTLQMVHQQFDETPMIWGMLVWIFIVYHKEIRRLPFQEKTVVTAFTAFGICFAVLHAIYHFTLVFQLLFGALAWACLFRITTHYKQSSDPRARAVCKTAMYASLIGFGLWMLDYNYCGHISELPINPQCHAWWHLLMGVCTYNAPLFMQFVRAEELEKKPELVDASWVGLQTIVVHDGAVKPKML